MTIIKQQSVTDRGSHQKNLRNYINDDRKVLARDSLNMEECVDMRRWAQHMSATREMFGHNVAARRNKDGTPATNTIMYHQILAFNPDECDMNGGKMGVAECMRYAKEYAEKYYPTHEIVMVLHKEHCKEDNTNRYAVHMVINRSDLATGKRLNEGRSVVAKRERASRVRGFDGRWGLEQVEEGVRNSKVHKRQPTEMERKIAERGGQSYRTWLRAACQEAAAKARNAYDFKDMLEKSGIAVTFKRGKVYVTDEAHARFSFAVSKLDSDLSRRDMDERFARNASVNPLSEQEVTELKSRYLADIRREYVAYRSLANEKAGTTFERFPRYMPSKPPRELDGDVDVNKALFKYWRGADELREKLASNVPYVRRASGKPGTTSGTARTQEAAQEQARAQERQAQTRANTKGRG